jgi:hypothetical protein
MYVCWSPQKVALPHMGKKRKVTIHGTPCRWTYSELWPGSPRGSLTTLLFLLQCHAALGMVPSTLAGVDQSPVSQRVL